MEKAIIYARVATKMQFDEARPIQYQLERCNEYAKKHKIEVVREFQFTGLKTKHQYHKLNNMLSFASSNKINTILVTGIDRIGRSKECIDSISEWYLNDTNNHLVNVSTGETIPRLQLGVMRTLIDEYSEEHLHFNDFLDELSSDEIVELIEESIYKAKERFGQELNFKVKSLIENI